MRHSVTHPWLVIVYANWRSLYCLRCDKFIGWDAHMPDEVRKAIRIEIPHAQGITLKNGKQFSKMGKRFVSFA